MFFFSLSITITPYVITSFFAMYSLDCIHQLLFWYARFPDCYITKFADMVDVGTITTLSSCIPLELIIFCQLGLALQSCAIVLKDLPAPLCYTYKGCSPSHCHIFLDRQRSLGTPSIGQILVLSLSAGSSASRQNKNGTIPTSMASRPSFSYEDYLAIFRTDHQFSF